MPFSKIIRFVILQREALCKAPGKWKSPSLVPAVSLCTSSRSALCVQSPLDPAGHLSACTPTPPTRPDATLHPPRGLRLRPEVVGIHSLSSHRMQDLGLEFPDKSGLLPAPLKPTVSTTASTSWGLWPLFLCPWRWAIPKFPPSLNIQIVLFLLMPRPRNPHSWSSW